MMVGEGIKQQSKRSLEEEENDGQYFSFAKLNRKGKMIVLEPINFGEKEKEFCDQDKQEEIIYFFHVNCRASWDLTFSK